MFERSLKLSLHIPKRFDAFEVLKLFLLLLEVTCVIFARETNTDVWQAVVLSLGKTVVSHFKDVRANCFCASLLRRAARANFHATSCIERARQVLK